MRHHCDAQTIFLSVRVETFSLNTMFTILHTLTGKQIRHKRISANARLAKKILVGLFIRLYPRIAIIIRRFPITPSNKVSL